MGIINIMGGIIMGIISKWVSSASWASWVAQILHCILPFAFALPLCFCLLLYSRLFLGFFLGLGSSFLPLMLNLCVLFMLILVILMSIEVVGIIIYNHSPLKTAANIWCEEAVFLLMEMDRKWIGSKYNEYLIEAAEEGYDRVVKMLLGKEGIQVNQADQFGQTPLILAAYKGHATIVGRLLQRDDVQVNQANKKGSTPLCFAAMEGHVKVVELLLNKEGIQVNMASNGGTTPLLIAAHQGHVKVVKMLLKKEGIEANLANLEGATPISVAADQRNGKIVDLLLRTEEIRAIGWDGWRPIATPG